MKLADTTTLCVIDMQTGFSAAYDVENAVIAEVKFAMKHNMGIVLLRYSKSGSILSGITNVLRRYPRKTQITKLQNDGGSEFIYAAKKKEFPTDIVRVVGVNRGYCVRETVCGMVDSFSVGVIQIVMNATGDSESLEQGRLSLNELTTCHKVSII